MIWQVQQFCRLKSGTKAHLYLIYNRGLVRAGPGNFHELPAKSPQNTYTPPAWHPQNRLFHLTSETISSASLQNHPGFRQKFTKTANETAKDGLLIFAKRQIVSICTKNREKSQKWKELTNPVFMRLLTDVMPLQNEKNQKNQKKLKKVVDICRVWWYYNQVAAIRQRQKLKETLINTGLFKNWTLITEQKDNLENSF